MKLVVRSKIYGFTVVPTQTRGETETNAVRLYTKSSRNFHVHIFHVTTTTKAVITCFNDASRALDARVDACSDVVTCLLRRVKGAKVSSTVLCSNTSNLGTLDHPPQ